MSDSASAQVPEVVGKIVYKIDLIGNYCGIEATSKFEAWSLRAFKISQKKYYKGYDEGAVAFDPEFKDLGAERWCEKHLPLVRKMYPNFLE